MTRTPSRPTYIYTLYIYIYTSYQVLYPGIGEGVDVVYSIRGATPMAVVILYVLQVGMSTKYE